MVILEIMVSFKNGIINRLSGIYVLVNFDGVTEDQTDIP